MQMKWETVFAQTCLSENLDKLKKTGLEKALNVCLLNIML